VSHVVSQLAPGTTVAGYRIEMLIGRGGMGAVYRALEMGLGRKVALKVIAPELAQDERFRERLLRESRIAASLDHPHVIPIYQAGDEAGVLFLAMRYVEGSDLAKVIAEGGALEPDRAVELLSQIAEALDAAHAQGLIHRDVKPSNILIAESAGREHCYLGDFGLTKRTGSLSGVSVAGNVVGTLEYVAPEQITGDPLDERSDVYSLGCVLYECLTGQAPFPRTTDVALLWAHVHEEPTPPSKARPELPSELDTVLARALAKEPGRRYRSAGELIAATRSALRLGDAPQAQGTISRRRVLVPIAAVAALGVIAGALGFALLGGSSGLSSVSPNAIGVIDPGSDELVAEVPVGIDPESIAVGEGSVWVANVEDETVSRIDPTTRKVVRTISVPDHPSDVAVGGGSVLVALGALGELVSIDPAQNEAASPIDALGDGATACRGPRASIAFGAGAAWFVCKSGQIGRVSTRTGVLKRVRLADVATPVEVRNPDFTDAAFGFGLIYLVNRKTNFVATIDPATNKGLGAGPEGAPSGWFTNGAPAAVAFTAKSVWVATFGDDTVKRLTFTRGPRDPFPPIPGITEVDNGPVDIAVGEGGVWVLNRLDASVSRIDEESGEVVATIDVGNEPQHIAAGEGFVWVTVRAPDDEPRAVDTTEP
jgi:YVTN family beta-propeller protein